MVRRRHAYDIYDDTGRGHGHRRAHENPSITVVEPGDRDYAPPDAVQSMDDFHAMQRHAHREMERAFAPMAGDMFGAMRGMMSSFERMFDDALTNMPASGSQYFYESKTRTVGPDGRVREETVRTAPDQDGRPQTSRVVREGDHAQQFEPFELNSPRLGDFHGMFERLPAPHDVHVEEVDDYPHRRSRRRRNSDVEIYEIDDEADRREDRAHESWARRTFRNWTGRQ